MRGKGKSMSNTKMFFTMIWGAVFRRRSRAIMAVIASMVGAATLFCLMAVCIAVPQQMNEEMRAYGANLVVTPNENGPQSGGIADAMVKHTTEMVRAKAEAKYATYRYETVRINAAPYVLAGIDVKQVKALNRHWDVEGGWPPKGSVMVGRDVADAMGLQVGSRITIGYRAADNAQTGDAQTGDAQTGAESASAAPADGADESARQARQSQPSNAGGGQGAGAANNGSAGSGIESDGSAMQDGRVSSDIMNTEGTEFRVCGIVDTGGSEDEMVYAGLADVERLAGSKRGADVIEYSVNAVGDDLKAIAASINEMTSMGVTAKQVTKITSSDTRIIAMLQTLFWIVSAVVLVLTLVGVGTTISSMVSQRRNEIGLRKALGASSASIGVEFYVESALYGLLGGLLGTSIGFGFAAVLTSTVFSRSLAFNLPLAVVSVLFSILVAVVASVPPVRRATRIDPAIVLREE